ncbi:iron uptake transporter deferrochelatase/peroxidase subunit [Xylanimonas ulmi]|uniref:Deferrochelatase n=1 Tax=Xylanimonas ulmi TaxID=228973 RepID=A0A4Q7LYK2_9MICO|nr:iron uptake transporter deferrochelatase/peroxidase subunit [Xylanibacterium ulmi]RZS60336.1 deferrochelatase/peroxidase EfeB [Xylanibacterium ulmi]
MTSENDGASGCPAHVGRRGFLRGLMGAAGAIGVGAVVGAAPAAASGAAPAGAVGAATDDTAERATRPRAVVPFHGEHQAGIVTPSQRAAQFVALDVAAPGRDGLEATLRTLTERARTLAAATPAPSAGPGAPPSDDGILGAEASGGADSLTITLSVGVSLFDDRFGLADRRPARLRVMDTFPDDNLDRAICDGDLLVQVCADERDTVLHAVRELLRATRGDLVVRWRQDGFLPPARPGGAPRNLLGFKDGTANPPTAQADQMDAIVWTHAGPTPKVDDQAARAFGLTLPDDLPDAVEPAWVEGGSYHVVRTTRMYVEFWDRVTLDEQEQMIGRRRDSGAPLTGAHEDDVPDFASDPTGDAIKLDAHIRLAGPRTPGAEAMRMLRRPFSYDNGTDPAGTLDVGLVFVCFVQDLDRQFVAVQRRLTGEPLVDYISPVGGGYFFALPGVRDKDDWYASALFA